MTPGIRAAQMPGVRRRTRTSHIQALTQGIRPTRIAGFLVPWLEQVFFSQALHLSLSLLASVLVATIILISNGYTRVEMRSLIESLLLVYSSITHRVVFVAQYRRTDTYFCLRRL
jgi:hypothetical protein